MLNFFFFNCPFCQCVLCYCHLAGTDATHAEHIETIKARNYVGVQNDGTFLPGTLGMGLVEGSFVRYFYNNVDDSKVSLQFCWLLGSLLHV